MSDRIPEGTPPRATDGRLFQRFICGGNLNAEGELSDAARAELADFECWLRLPKPRPEFREWRKSLRAEVQP